MPNETPTPEESPSKGQDDSSMTTEPVEPMNKGIHRWLVAWLLIVGLSALFYAVCLWPNTQESISSFSPTSKVDSTHGTKDSSIVSATPPADTSRKVAKAGIAKKAPWMCYGAVITLEEKLLMISFLFGILGGSTHGLASLMDFRGQRRLFKSWALWYFGSPLLGGMMAVIFYVVMRAGLFSGATGSNDAVNVYGVAAFSGLAGLFTDAASDKLAEVFKTIFSTKGNDRDGKLTAPH